MSIRSISVAALVLAHVTAVRASAAPAKQPAAVNVAKPLEANASKLEKTSTSDKRHIVGILEVRVEGVPKEIAAQFQSNLEKQLDSREYWLAPRSRMMQMLANSRRWTEGCVVGKCLGEVRTQTGAEIVLLASITGADSSFGYVVTLVRTDTGSMLSQESERCDVCTVDEALSGATLAAVNLLTDVPETLPDEKAQARAALTKLADTRARELARTKRTHRRIAIATVLTGLAIAGAGSAIYFVKDKPPWALATAAGGAGLMVGGMFAINF